MNPRRTLWILCAGLVGAACAAPFSTSAPGQTTPRPQPLQARLEAALGAPQLGSALAATAIVGDERETAVRGVLHGEGPSADAQTRFNVASVSKLLTAARVVSLAHAQVISLDDSVADHLPGVRVLDASGADLAPAITLRQLLRHTGGLPHFPPDVEQRVAGRWQAPDLLGTLTQAWDLPLVRPPGQYGYSNLGYVLLAAIIEREGQCSFAVCMKLYLQELGMTGATFWPADLPANAAHGLVRGDGAPDFHPPTWYGSRYSLPFSGLWTSMPDLARFGEALAQAAVDPEAPLHLMTTGEGHGLGPLHGSWSGAASLEHDGSARGFHAALVVVPSQRMVLAIATNGGDETPEQAAAFGGAVRRLLEAVAP